MAYVYQYTDPSRAEPIYVGMGQKKRAWYHLRRDDMHPFVQRLQKMKRDGVQPEIKLVVDGVNEELADLIETELIAKIGRKDLGLGPLLNMTDGGDGLKNASAETRRKIGEASRARKPDSDETRAKKAMGSRSRVYSHSPATIEKIRAQAVGRPLSSEHRTKIGVSGSKPCTIDGVDIYSSLKELKESLGQGARGMRHPNFRYV